MLGGEIVHAIIQDAWTHWIAEDGLMSLTRGEFREPFPEAIDDLQTVTNDNGILFSTIFFMLCRRALGPDVVSNERWRQSVERLEVDLGLYERNPGRGDSDEAHDNPAAIAAGSVLFAAPPFRHHFARDICEYGERNGWVFNNRSPGKFNMAQLRQGGEVAFLKICAGYKPHIFEWAWFCLGTFIGLFYITRDASGTQLKWMRMEAIREVLKSWDYRGWQWIPISFGLLDAAFRGVLWCTGGMRRVWGSYYTAQNPEHPIVLMAQALNV